MERRINFFTASFMGVLGLSMIGEVIMEDDPMDKIDDLLMVLLGVAAIYWYKKTGYKLNKTVGSTVILIIAILTKVFAIYVEHADREAVGDDFGILAALVIAFIFITGLQYARFLRIRPR